MLQKQLKQLELEINDSAARIRLHDARLRHSVRSLTDEAVHGIGHKVAIGAGVAAVGWLLWPGRRRRARQRAAERAHHAETHPARQRAGGAPPWLNTLLPYLLPVLTPLLNPKVAESLASLGVPIHPAALEPLATVEDLDLTRYAGQWYEVARLPTKHEKACASDATAEYVLGEHGGLVVRNRCVHADGETSEVEGQVRRPDPRHPGRLEVAFAPGWLRWWPGAWADYWVMTVDTEYQVALVGTPDRQGLWVLSRQPQVHARVWEELTALAQSEGFDTSRLQRTPHRAPEAATPQAVAEPA